MLRRQIIEAAKEAGADEVAAAFYDYETETSWSYQGDRWFHAASTIKVAILISIYAAIAEGKFRSQSRVHIRNRFLSAFDGEPFRIYRERDANVVVHDALGKSMKVRELAYHMIVTSSNFATNLLLDVIGVAQARETLDRLGITGVDLLRGVEDEKAFSAGINNRVTALGLLRLFRLIQDGAFSQEISDQMLEILLQQEFRSGIPAGLPDEIRSGSKIAHKTGEISTVSHDAGLVFLPDRQPYAVSILTEWAPEKTTGRKELVAGISHLIFEHLADSTVER